MHEIIEKNTFVRKINAVRSTTVIPRTSNKVTLMVKVTTSLKNKETDEIGFKFDFTISAKNYKCRIELISLVRLKEKITFKDLIYKTEPSKLTKSLLIAIRPDLEKVTAQVLDIMNIKHPPQIFRRFPK